MKTLNKEQFETLKAFWEQYSKYNTSGFFRPFKTEEEALNWLKPYVDKSDDKVCRLVFAVVDNRAFLGVHHVYANSGKTKSEVYELTDGKKLLVNDYGYRDTESIDKAF